MASFDAIGALNRVTVVERQGRALHRRLALEEDAFPTGRRTEVALP